MKKRIISILLCVLMLATSAVSLFGCGEGKLTIYDKNKAAAMTITITTIYDDYDENNAEQKAALKLVQDALNKITEVKFNTHVVIQPMKSEDYMEQILTMSEKINAELKAEEASLEKLKQDKKAQKKKSEITLDEKLKEISKRTYTSKYQVMGDGYLTAANNDSVYKDIYGRYKTVYPSSDKNGNYTDTGAQLDIVLVNSVEMYNKMVEEGYLLALDSTLLGKKPETAKLIQKQVNLFAYDQVEMDDKLYAIPNNTVYGEYSYILINKELYEQYGYDINFDYNVVGGGSNGVDDFSDVENFIMDVMNDPAQSGCRPVLNNPGLDFLSIFGRNSVIIADAVSQFNKEVGASPSSITTSPIFQSHFRTMYQLTKLASDRQPVTGEWLTAEELRTTYKDYNYAVAFVKGNLDVQTEFGGTTENPGDYHVVVTHAPYVDNNIYESMYGISSCVSADILAKDTRPERCLEILELFSTNKEWVNLLTYGVNGEHYDFSVLEDNVVTNRSEKYTFDRKYAGNMFLQYVSDDMDPVMKEYAADGWDLAKRQNQKLSVSPYAGFVFKTETKQKDADGNLTGEKETLYVELRDKEKLTVEDMLATWAEIDLKYYDMLFEKDAEGNYTGLYNFDHYEAYIAENPGASFGDYYTYFFNLLKADSNGFYDFVTSTENPNTVQEQYLAYFILLRDHG